MGALACSLVALLLSGGHAGTRYLNTVVQDDAMLLHRSPAVVRHSMDQIQSLGADHVRLTASWSTLAPAPTSTAMPGGAFDASDSSTYPKGAFTALDTAVKDADADNLDVMIDLAFWAPRWATAAPSPNGRQRKYVSAAAFGDFAHAVAERYNGAYPDPADHSQDLPAVRMFTTWNEPNHPSFLSPQWVKNPDGTYRPESPHEYRAMHDAAYDAIKKVAPQDQVLVGGLASLGSDTPGKGGVPPLAFVRALACVDDRLQPLHVPECAGYTPLKADGFAIHPYSRYTTPGTDTPNPDDVPIAGVSRLDVLLGKLAAIHRIATDLPIYDTEYGYESSEDDPYQPFDREQQGEFMGWSTYLAWKEPDTRMFGQFLLRDVDPHESGKAAGTRSYFRDWQSGLYTYDGKPKPAAQAFKLPFWAQTEGTADHRVVLLFGGARPARKATVVEVQELDPQSGNWNLVQTYGPSCDSDDTQFLTDASGYFLRTAPSNGAATYRMGWQHDDGTWEYSLPIKVADDGSVPPPV